MQRAPTLGVLASALGAIGLTVTGGVGDTACAGQKTAQNEKAQNFFLDVSERVGLRFVHYNAEEGKLDLPEITGPGGALFDMDGDGDLDVYLVQGAKLRPPSAPRGGDRIFRNQLVESGTLFFVDVTDSMAVKANGYGMGIATGDIDNDGDVDLFVANFGANQLWRNDGHRFVDATAPGGGAADLSGQEWSIGGSFFDYDRDGWLDLFVINYTEYPVNPPVRCFASTSRRDYCGPSAFEPVADRLYRNRGDGTFEDVSTSSGIGRNAGPGLGALAADFDGDSLPDIYVTNDGSANFLWRGTEAGIFSDQALFAGIALNQLGQPEASMGVSLGDFDGDGDEDLFVTHLDGESNTLYVNQGEGLWEDRTIELGLAIDSRAMTGFGTLWFDIDNDGWLDLAAVNGRVRLPASVSGPGSSQDLRLPNQLWRNRGGLRFEEVSQQAGDAFVGPEVSRGLAGGDVDNDGDLDLLLINNGGTARLLLNQVGNRQPWLGLRLMVGSRDAAGAQVLLARDGARPLLRRAHTDGSYASANDPRVLFGLGANPNIGETTVRWPDGQVEQFPPPPKKKYTTLKKGRGLPKRREKRRESRQ